MAIDLVEQATNSILGALVADAAAVGLHWIYDQDHIRELTPNSPEFRPPCASDYQGVPGYFAHATRRAGDQSQYGEQALIMLQSLAANKGHFDVNHFAMSFRAHFGYGGAYVGYIDHATRQTLDNFTRAEETALLNAKTIPFDGDDSITKKMVVKALAINNQFGGDEALRKFEEAVRITHDNDTTVVYGLSVLDQIQRMPVVAGADDEQFPATAKLPPLIAIGQIRNSANGTELFRNVEAAIKVTNTHERAISYGMVSANMMQAAIVNPSINSVLETGLTNSKGRCHSDIKAALAMNQQTVPEVTHHFGMACDLKYGLPSIAHNLKVTASFQEAIRNNIYAGGDSCGRAIILGAIAGALYGVGGETGIPEAWIERLSCKHDINALISVCVNA